MFKVKNKTTEQIYTVYNVQQGLGFAYFLIYNESGWHWETSSFYESYEEPPQESTYVPVYPYIPYQPYDPIKNPFITWTTNTEPTK